MNVIKRDNRKESVCFDKISNRINLLSSDLNVNIHLIAKKVISQIHDNIKTSKLDELVGEICINLSSENPDYAILAKRIVISNNHKETPTFTEYIQIAKDANLISKSLYSIVMLNKDLIEYEIDETRDFDFDYFGFKTLEKNYLLRVGDKIIERIGYLFMRVSLGLHDDLTNAFESYKYMSQRYFIHATPTLFNSGTQNPQLLSCFLLGTEDSMDGIYKTITDCSKISKWSGGLGVHVSNIRSKGSLIKGTNGKSSGIVPMLRVYNSTALYVNQGGKRNGSIAIYLEPHHPDIGDFLELRKNSGYEENRCRDLFTALWISDLFMTRVENNQEWSLFDPDRCKGLNERFGIEYENHYKRLEKQGLAVKVVNARDLWKRIISSQVETGTPYILFKDNVNKYNNQSNLGIIKSSNLCAEICEYSSSKEYACCVLASIGLPKFIENAQFNLEKLGEVVRVIVKNLNRVIDLNYYPVPETQYSNWKHRPIGIGVQGLADVFAMLKIDFDSTEARKLNLEIFDTIYYYAVLESNQLAIRDGPYSSFSGSPMSKGIFQHDMRGVNSIYDWTSLRKDVIKHGCRNSLLTALMPTATTSQILGNTECFEPITSNIYTRRTLAGDFIIVNKHLVRELIEEGIWSTKIKNSIIEQNGSIAHLNIREDIKSRYRTAFELPQKALIQLSIDRSAFICQSQSLNLFFKEPNMSNLTSALFFGWKNGLKTGSYYIRSQPKAQAQQFTISCSSCSA